MKKAWVAVLAVLLVAISYLALFPFGQRPDRSFDATVREPAYSERHPTILFDEGHHNAHTIKGGFRPFASLMQNDGYQIRRNTGALTPEALNGVDVLVIVNAAGGSNPKLFGINLVPLRKGEREGPAFTEMEVQAVRTWVEGGGSLLLIADHYPFGTAAAPLAAALGVTMGGGYAEVEDQYPGQNDPGAIRYSRQNGLLAEHPLTRGRSPEERVDLVMSFTGQSLDGAEVTPILKLPASAVEYVPPPPDFKPQAAGKAQAVALEYGRGRVVVLGEAGMLTAQVDDNGNPFGMNVEGVDNRQFALNVMHWLSRLL